MQESPQEYNGSAPAPTIRFGSVCSGIEAASLVFRPLGWRAAWFSEIEPFPSAVLAHHYPEIPNLGDMTLIADRVEAGEIEAPDVLCGGTPCQAFSISGLRGSLGDARGQLTLEFVRIADATDRVRRDRGEPECVVFWENVPGVLSAADNAFGCFLGALAGCDTAIDAPPGRSWTDAGVVAGPRRTVAWRVLDAQYFGLAQRRRRVFVVASAREGFDPASVLLEFEGVRRDSAPRREAGEGAAVGTLGGASPSGGWRFGADEAAAGQLVPAAFGGNNTTGAIDVATARNACASASASGRMDFETETFIVQAVHGTQDPDVCIEMAHTLGRNHGQENAIAFDPTQITSRENRSNPQPGGPCHTLAKGAHAPAIATPLAVRRLMPVECERLQGAPDGYTAIPHRGRPAADGPRYKAIGNSWAINCVAWIGRRLDAALREPDLSVRGAGRVAA